MTATPRIDTTSRFDSQTGPKGFRLCRQCGQECPNARKSYCSKPCVTAWRLERWPSVQRDHVWERDGGVCELCRRCVAPAEKQTKGLFIRLRDIWHGWHRPAEFSHLRERTPRQEVADKVRALRHGLRLERALRSWLTGYAFDPSKAPRSLWEMDHRVPLAEGGTNALDNLRVLCVPCHRGVTKALAGRLAERRREARAHG